MIRFHRRKRQELREAIATSSASDQTYFGSWGGRRGDLIEQRAFQAYRSNFLEEPVLVASAPGRIISIGEHTDYNGGFVCRAIDRRVSVAIGYPDHTDLNSADFQEKCSLLEKREGLWADYPGGVVWE